MRIFAVILLALTSVAYADEHGGRVSLGDHPKQVLHHDGDWTQLAGDTAAKHGTEYLMVGRDAGEFSQLRIVADGGRVEVRRVHVFFSDGSDRTYPVDRALGRKHERAVTIALKTSQPIDRIAVTTSRDSDGTYSVYGG